MVQFIDLGKKENFASNLGNALGQGLSAGTQFGLQENYKQARSAEAAQKSASALQEALKSVPAGDTSALMNAVLANPAIDIEHKKLLGNYLTAQVKASKPKAPPGGLGGQPVPPEVGSKIKEIIDANPLANSDQLAISFDEAGIPRGYSGTYIENRRKQDEQRAKTAESRSGEKHKETSDLRKDIANKAIAAEQSIANKENQLDIINKGKLTDPSVAAVLDALPFKLGQRFLSDDTAQYKATLVDDFKDMGNTFKGSVRVAEIDIWEAKLADTYLTDDQKRKIIKARMDSLNVDVIRAEEAAKLEEEKPDLGILQFTRELNERVKPRMKAIQDQVFDQINSAFDDAERMKGRVLDYHNPSDYEVGRQILKEAKGDIKLAYKIAEKKGYKLPRR